MRLLTDKVFLQMRLEKVKILRGEEKKWGRSGGVEPTHGSKCSLAQQLLGKYRELKFCPTPIKFQISKLKWIVSERKHGCVALYLGKNVHRHFESEAAIITIATTLCSHLRVRVFTAWSRLHMDTSYVVVKGICLTMKAQVNVQISQNFIHDSNKWTGSDYDVSRVLFVQSLKAEADFFMWWYHICSCGDIKKTYMGVISINLW